MQLLHTSFDEIRRVAASLPVIDANLDGAITAAAMPTQADAASVLGWLVGAQRRARPRLDHPRMALFAAAHGNSMDTLDGALATIAGEIALVTAGGGMLHQAIEEADSDLKLYELAADRPTRDSRLACAMTESETARAIAYGMMVVDAGLDAVAISALGHAADLSAMTLGLSIFPRITAPARAEQMRIQAAIELHADTRDPLALLAALGGPDIAAMVGVILAARLAGTPVILDGIAAHAAAAVALQLRRDALDHCRLSEASGWLALDDALGIAAVVTSAAVGSPLAGVMALSSLAAACALLD